MVKTEWRRQSDQAQQFMEECCILDPQAEVSSQEVWNRYAEWAGSYGIKRSLARNTLTSRLKRLGVVDRKTTGGQRMLSGITLQPE
ncbi:MAG: hypothetical protein HQM04_18505 [Magnetococcales bacterium]|nr:hypothetical protein [Magnetococcales bacterium]